MDFNEFRHFIIFIFSLEMLRRLRVVVLKNFTLKSNHTPDHTFYFQTTWPDSRVSKKSLKDMMGFYTKSMTTRWVAAYQKSIRD
jgi:hypothetical protein